MIAAAWKRGQEGWPRSYPVVQFPNWPLLLALGAGLAARPATGDADDVLVAVSRVGLTIWAYEELVHGANAFRRVLGAGGLVLVVVRLAGL